MEQNRSLGLLSLARKGGNIVLGEEQAGAAARASRARLMLLNHCPMRTAMHLDKGRVACALCEKGKGARGTYLTDRMNAAYPFMPMRLPEGCLIGLYAPKPLHLSGLLSDARDLSWQLNFTLETPEERLALTAHYAALLRGEDAPPVSCAGTVGRFLEGVR